MQVEMSKCTEGISDKLMRNDELSVSLIHYDSESTSSSGGSFMPIHAMVIMTMRVVSVLGMNSQTRNTMMSSITEVVQKVKDPRACSQEEEPMEPLSPVTPPHARAATPAPPASRGLK
jgi:hypothetical protein